MHGYFHHIGDWMTHTAYCEWMVYAAYHKMLMAYYVAERPMPDDPPAIYRAIGAITSAEKEAAREALQKFFILAPDGCWHQKRADEEIERVRRNSDTQRKNINKRWEAKQSVTQSFQSVNVPNKSVTEAVLESTNAGLGEKRMRTNTNGSEQVDGYDGNSTGNTAVIPPINHEFNTFLAAAAATDVGCVRACEAAAAAGIEVKANDPRLVALVADGATPGEFRFAAAKAAAAGKGVAWFFAALAGMRQESGSGMAQEGTKSGSGGPNYPMLPRWYDPH